ncbi:hypothetical protein MKK69_14020 [Methylobacterium sp. J-026]|uniref:hypothetical protein n=1 Tax=Methylobacterium sp. J-026 TaxID=2836624 RepID=UPI001FBB532F|nr:hypothetical protein [Methylobacterium sp. J-026]MCJ2135158.1 hypothetical protein [Methylobacterium sp. J-026]
MIRPTRDSGTATRKPEDAVGSPGGPAAGGGHQTAEQAAITDMGAAPRTEPKDGWGSTGDSGRAPPAIGGSSGGQSDRKAAAATDDSIAGGLSRAERETRDD